MAQEAVGPPEHSTGTLAPHQPCESGIITFMLMVIKARGSDMAKVTQLEGG